MRRARGFALHPRCITIALMTGLAIAALTVTAAAITRSGAVTIELRVWQDVDEPLTHYVSARPEGGDWRTLGTIPLPLDDGHSGSGRFRYGDLALEVPLDEESETCRWDQSLERVRRGVFRVAVMGESGREEGGTAFHIGGGELVTVGHFPIFANGEPFTIALQNATTRLEDVQLVGYRSDESGDVALLRAENVPEGLEALQWREEPEGPLAVAILGYPVATYVAGLPRGQVRFGEADPAYQPGPEPFSEIWAPGLESDLGYSGAPLVDACGRVLGVHHLFTPPGSLEGRPVHAGAFSQPDVGRLLDTIREEAKP